MGDQMLGHKGKDVITGFSGRATGYVRYISGCNQFLLVSDAGKDGSIKAEWFDEQRVKFDAKTKPIVLDNSAARGADRPAPKR